ncbi:tetratricopeptide repeat protein [Salipiger aestuarii]|uniref:tetratricopeptide repeat protein n=1 Tax=Salipiger aestuarii TaxID=568098 RepID=UPI00123AF008|nr:tetratricopeptide repeat protein [Salipiger aestuarii]
MTFKLLTTLTIFACLAGVSALWAQEGAAPGAGLSAPREAQPMPEMSDIEADWARGDFVSVRAGLRRLAQERGDAFSAYRYGRVLLEGRGGPVDVAQADHWLSRAAEGGNVDAATLLARVYLSNIPGGPPREPARAAGLLSQAAARGNAEAQYLLGLLTDGGTGVPQDAAMAYNWFLAAAEQQHPGAQLEVSRALSRGKGTALDTGAALDWLTRAAENGEAEAQFYLSNAYESGGSVPANPTEAMRWLRRSAEAGFLPAQGRLGAKHLAGGDVAQDPAEARRWLGRAAQAGSARALYLLGLAYLGEDGGAADPAQALQALRNASGQGHGPATLRLAQLAETGLANAMAADFETSVALYRKALAEDQPEAAPHLGSLAARGRLDGLVAPHQAVPWVLAAAGTGDVNAEAWLAARAGEGLRPALVAQGRWLLDRAQPAGAAESFRTAAQMGDTDAQYELGRMYSQGTGLVQDYLMAHAWLNVSAAGGNDAAAELRGVIGDLIPPEEEAAAQARVRAFFAAVAQADPGTPVAMPGAPEDAAPGGVEPAE